MSRDRRRKSRSRDPFADEELTLEAVDEPSRGPENHDTPLFHDPYPTENSEHQESSRSDEDETVVLRVTGGLDDMAFVRLSPGTEIDLGRSDRNTLPLHSLTVSRRHARIVHEADRVVIRDLGSRNGITVNGERLRRATVKPGDRITVGAVRLRLEVLTEGEVQLLEVVRHRLARARDEDPLTGLFTRQYLDSPLPRIMDFHLDRGDRISLLFLDLDRFKRINDQLGHLTGDRVLEVMGEALRQACRETDAPLRYGGEEFLLFLFGAGEDAAAQVAERLRARIERWNWHPIHPELAVTVSVGVAEYDPREDVEGWIRRADEALYRAKREGRNRVSRAGMPPED